MKNIVIQSIVKCFVCLAAFIFLTSATYAQTEAQAQAVKVLTTKIYPGENFTVEFLLARRGTIPQMSVRIFLIDPYGQVTLLGTEPYTTTGVKRVSVRATGPFYGPATGWTVTAVEATQNINNFIDYSDPFSVDQAPPNIEFRPLSTSSSDRLIIASGPNATADGPITSGQTTYFQALLRNSGVATATGYKLRTLLDGQQAFDDEPIPLDGNEPLPLPGIAMPGIAAGPHTLTLQVLNSSNSVTQTLTEQFTVTSNVDLIPFAPSGWSSPLVVAKSAGSTTGIATFTELEAIFVSFGYRNNGTGTSIDFKVRVYVDGQPIGSSLASSGLVAGASGLKTGIQLGLLPVGLHQIQAVIDSDSEVFEFNEGNNTFQQIITVTAPKISVENSGMALSDGISTVTFPQTISGSATILNLTVKNTGTSTLEINPSEISFTGAQAAEFSTGLSTITQIPQGGSALLPVRLSPATAGMKSAQMHIRSNVTGVTNPFDLNLMGSSITELNDWRNRFFPGSTATNGNGADLATPWNDGVPNLIKFATGMDPTKPGTSPGRLEMSAGTGEMIFSFFRSQAATRSGVDLQVEWTDDLSLGNWSTAGVSTFVADGDLNQQVTARIPMGPHGSRFVRLGVSSNGQ